MTHKEELIKRQNDINNQIEQLYDEINSLSSEIAKEEEKEFEKSFSDIGMEEGTYFIGFSKQDDYHYDAIKILHITELDSAFKVIQCVCTIYRIDDCDVSVHIREELLNFKYVKYFFDEYNVYSITELLYNEILKDIVSLNIGALDIRTYQKYIKDKCNK